MRFKRAEMGLNLEYNYLDVIKEKSPMVGAIIEMESRRQEQNIELIASENYPSDAVMAACGSCMMNKYTEGYPGKRYYGGCENFDRLEKYGEEVFQKAFKTNYHFNLQPHSGSSANFIAYASVLRPGDKILSMDMNSGAHLTHSSPVSLVSRMYNVVTYWTDSNGFLCYEDIESIAEKEKPQAIVCGASAYPREIDFKEFERIAKNVGAILIADIAHISGLVVAECHNSPFGHADIVTMTTQKTFRGPRGGVVACKPELAKKVDSACFPLFQGGAIQSNIAGKVVAAEEATTREYKEYIHQVVKNTKAMAKRFKERGFELVTGGTDNHLLLIDLSNKGLTGKQVQDFLDENGITVNKNMVPSDTKSPQQTSGIRIGLAAMTTRGWDEFDAERYADEITHLINNMSIGSHDDKSI